jgi:hypothetical protein
MSRFGFRNSAFWIVASDVNGMASVPHKHDSREAAFNEAKRLTTLHGGKFYVFEAIGSVARNDVQVSVFDEDEIPV